jgi:hypothetical protein
MHEAELLAAVVMRHLERLVVVVAGMQAIWLGYRLFIAMPNSARGDGKIELPGGISIFISRVGPGVFFALFGALVLGYSLHETVKVNASVGSAPAAAGAGTAEAGTAPRQTFEYSGVGPKPMTPDERASERMKVLDTVRKLAALARSLDGPAGRNLSAEERVDTEIALRESRRRLLASVWDERAWGTIAAFDLWLQKGETDPVPPEIANAVRVYRGGS